MKHKTWPLTSNPLHFSALPFTWKPCDASAPTKPLRIPISFLNPSPKLYHPSSSSASGIADFSALPYDVLSRIAASFTLPNLRAASLVCRSWTEALKPLREAMVFLKWGKRFKHGRGGVKPNLGKALDAFLKGAARGSTLAMVDAGLIYWEMGKKEKGIVWYRKAADLGDPAGQCNLAISYLLANPPKIKEAIEWLYRASFAGHVRAQYQLALCLHQGRGVGQSLQEAVDPILL